MALEIKRQRADEAQPVYLTRGGRGLRTPHPCSTRHRGWDVTATCGGCAVVRWIDLEPLLKGPLAHAPWSRVMESMTCAECGSRPAKLIFEKRDNQTMRMVLFDLIERVLEQP